MKHRIKWKCEHCGKVHKWKWSLDDTPGLVYRWICGHCDTASVFWVYEKRLGEWRRDKGKKLHGKGSDKGNSSKAIDW